MKAKAATTGEKKPGLGACPAADWTKKVDWEAYLTGGKCKPYCIVRNSSFKKMDSRHTVSRLTHAGFSL